MAVTLFCVQLQEIATYVQLSFFTLTLPCVLYSLNKTDGNA